MSSRAPDDRILSAKSDYIFKKIFADPKNAEILSSLLSAVLELPDDELESIEIIDPHLMRESADDKLGILDVKVKTKRQTVIDIEIQILSTPDIQKRIVYYTSKMVTEQIGISGKYFDLKRVVSIIISNFNTTNGAKYHHTYRLRDGSEEWTDLVEINSLELTKLPEAEDGTPLWDWLKFLKAERKEELEMLAERSPEIKKAVAIIKTLSADEQVRLEYESREKQGWTGLAG